MSKPCANCGSSLQGTGRTKYCSSRCSDAVMASREKQRRRSNSETIRALKARIEELEEFNEHLKLENRILREHGPGLMGHIQVAKAQREQ